MLGFSEFREFITEGVRQGLPHITTMNHDQFSNLVSGGKIHVNKVTEKTDGIPHEFGYDEKGFYTRTKGTGEEKVRSPQQYHDLAKKKAEGGRSTYNPDKANTFGHIHSTLFNNSQLQSHLKAQHQKEGADVRVKGEMFYKPLSQPSEAGKNERRFVATSYRTDHMGSVGKFVIHSELPENKNHNIEHFKSNLSSKELNFDDDKIDHKKGSVNVSKEAEQLKSVNKDLINARTTKTNKAAKTAEIAKFDKIKNAVSKKVDSHVTGANIKPKWGSESEGFVVHPSRENPSAPRFKVTSESQRQKMLAQKQDPSKKIVFKRAEDL